MDDNEFEKGKLNMEEIRYWLPSFLKKIN